MSRYPDVAPTVVVGPNYGHYSRAIEFDLPSITHYLQAGGLTDEEIIDTTIELSDRHPRYDAAIAGYVLGEYNHAQRKITAYANHLAFDAYVCVPDAGVKFEEELNNTLVHELEHRVASLDDEQKVENGRYARDHANFRLLMYAGAATIGGVIANTGNGVESVVSLTVGAIAPLPAVRKLLNRESARRNLYLRHPEEVRCRQAAQQELRTFIYPTSRTLELTGITTTEAFNNMVYELGEQYDANAEEREAQVREEEHIAANAKYMDIVNKWVGAVIRSPYFRTGL